MKFAIGKEVKKGEIHIEGEGAGFYETNLPFTAEHVAELGTPEAFVIVEDEKNKAEFKAVEQSWDDKRKEYTKILKHDKKGVTALAKTPKVVI